MAVLVFATGVIGDPCVSEHFCCLQGLFDSRGGEGLTTLCSCCFTTVERLRRGMVVAQNMDHGGFVGSDLHRCL